jgi:hypothetical protein
MLVARLSLLIVAVLAVGCASDAEDADVGAGEGDPVVEADKLFPRQFAQVCRGTAGQPSAAAYVAEPGVHPFLIMTSVDGIEYQGASGGSYPEGWRVSWPNLMQAELVVCAYRTVATPVDVCEGYEDDDSGVQWSVQTHDAVYDYVVRVARTGEVLGSTKFEVPAGPCPQFSMYRERGPQPQPTYPTPSAGAIEVFVSPFVRGD